MWLTRVCVCIVICMFIGNVCAKRFDTRCKLVRELIKCGMPSDIFLGQWVCLIEKVSRRDTSLFVETSSKKKTYGLFQIPSRWCREGKRGGECHITCESLLDDDIRDDITCAVKIFHREGFKYWSQWNTRCKNDILITNEIYKCPDLISPRSSPERYTPMDTFRHMRRNVRNIIKFSKKDFYDTITYDDNMYTCPDASSTTEHTRTPTKDYMMEGDILISVRSKALRLYGAYSRPTAAIVTSSLIIIFFGAFFLNNQIY